MAFELVKDRVQQGVIPYLNLKGAAAASDFYQRAFGAKELMRMPDPGNPDKIVHCRLEINGGLIMLSDEFPEHGMAHQPSHSFTMQLVVADIDAWFQRAVDAGVEVTTPVQKMFWGDRFGAMKDPFGIHWAMNEPSDQ